VVTKVRILSPWVYYLGFIIDRRSMANAGNLSDCLISRHGVARFPGDRQKPNSFEWRSRLQPQRDAY
jgi:hypothetical protein